ncbi:MAG TPA: leucine--tRNA ligase [Acidimicrobiia bacterium]|nr:leucine--tRNA ligase [Acidimicrobiia bacterium]
MTAYDHLEIERKWQEYWDRHGTFRAGNPGDPGFDASRPKMYVLDMFPYPSGEGLHVGHPIGYIGTDIFTRYQRMRGYNVLHPMGFDSFGLPAEQYAVETGIHPRVTTERNEARYEQQLRSIGLSYDWSRKFSTTDVGYYRWTQWIFLRLFDSWFDDEANRARPIGDLMAELESGERLVDGVAWGDLDEVARRRHIDGRRLAYIDDVVVNWCPALGTVLANEEVTRDGKSERGDHPVFRRPLRQWMLRITAYADRLIDDLDLVEWPESVKVMQRNWIGRSEGAWIEFPVAGSDQVVRVFTTRPDTIFGATYMVLAPEHPLVQGLIADEWPEGSRPAWTGGAGSPRDAVSEYVEEALERTELDRQADSREKTGVFTGSFCVNPATGEPIPIFIADYVLLAYGTGAIMGVPGQDERDWEFAELFDLPIVRTVQPPEGFEGKAYLEDGPAINSGFLDGLSVADAKAKITEWLESEGLGTAAITYKLHDWLFSRQRYWGEPIPILHGPDGELRAVDASDLPVLLPEVEDFRPDTGQDEQSEPVPALGRADEEWRSVVVDGVRYERELNTMPQWAGSCWYYLRFADPNNEDRFVGEDAERYWMGEGGVDLYVGGVEHAVLHLLYARFWHKVLFDLGFVSTPEPFGRLFNQGYILADAFVDDRGIYVPAEKVEEHDGIFLYEGMEVERRTGSMGKSKKNSITPDEFISRYGADTLRLYEMFMGPLDASKPWTIRDVVGVERFLQRLWRNHVDPDTGALLVDDTEPDEELMRLLHRTIRQVTEDMSHLRFNTAVARLFELNNALVPLETVPRVVSEAFVRILAPLAPHVAEELWERLGNEPSISGVSWPEYDEELAREHTVTLVVQVGGKVRDRIEVPADVDEETARGLALGSERVREILEGAEPSRVIVRPPNLVNVVP